jgi:hypothetical protein
MPGTCATQRPDRIKGELAMSADPKPKRARAGFNMIELVPDFFERFFAFFRPGHQEGVVPSRIKELARLKIAEINGCDT